MNEKQQQLIFDKGITNIPSDAICSDNTLEESLGLVYENGEHRVIQKPEEFITSAQSGEHTFTPIPRLLYIHRFNNQERYIVAMASGPQTFVGWGVKNGTVYVHNSFLEDTQSSFLPYSSSTKISSIGKTLIISDGSGLHYFLWKDTSYQSLGSQIPRPKVFFSMTSPRQESEVIRADGMLEWDLSSSDFRAVIKTGKQNDWNNAVVGLYETLRKRIWRKKLFHGSFCIRIALKLFDGSYYHVSNPIFMLNQFSAKGLAVIWGDNDAPPDLSVFHVRMSQEGQSLEYYHPSSTDYSQWADIVKGIVVFVTKESDLYDTTVDEPLTLMQSDTYLSYFMIAGINGNKVQPGTRYTQQTPALTETPYFVLDSKEDTELENTIKEGVYYKLFELGVKGDNKWHDAGEHFGIHSLENITTQDQLGADDYFSHSILKPDMLYAYNSRLNLANAQRSVFEGFDFFMPFDSDSSSTYKFYVTVSINGGDVVVLHEHSTQQKQGIYFFYPDPRATHVVIFKGNTCILNENLTEHPTLNGAYYFNNSAIGPNMQEPSSASTPSQDQITPTDPAPFETLPNTLITSEVNNPFVFRAEGYNDVGVGQIIGMSTITDALSEGQFGQYPLLVFTTEGIWALAVSSTGTYTKADPMSREVCNNPNSITQTDGAVFFSSDKGLMVIAGRQVKCVSEQLSGKDGSFESLTVNMGENFRAYLSDLNCSIAYDYRDSLLWIINKSIERTNRAVCWVYNIKNGTFSKQVGQVAFVRTINHYPDTLLQDDDGKVYSLLSRPDVAHDNNTYNATLVTRPLKLENALALKSILQVRHITAFHPYTVSVEGEGTVGVDSVDIIHPSLTFKVYASNNLTSWVQLRSLRGTPWKYYRFVYTFTDLRADDHFAGSVLITQERRTNRLR